MLNRVTLAGRMGKDPELRHTNSGTAVATFSLACDRDFKDKATGEKVTDWVNIVAWRSTAEYVSRYGSKGRTVIVDGRLQVRDWTDKDGNKRTSTEVVAESVYFADGQHRDGDGDFSRTADTPRYNAPAGDAQFSELSDGDGDLPF